MAWHMICIAVFVQYGIAFKPWSKFIQSNRIFEKLD